MMRPEEDPEGGLASAKSSKKSGILYRVEETAPWHITLMFIIQQVVMNSPGKVVLASLVHSAVCGGDDYGFLAELVASSVILCGIGTILQISLGIRLPIVQGMSFLFIAPLFAAMSSDKYKCPSEAAYLNKTMSDELPPWNSRIRVVSGSLMVAAAIQVLLGLTGVFGLLIPYVGPLTIAPAISLVGLSLYPAVINSSQHQWGIAILTATIVIVCAIGLRDVQVPLPTCNKRDGFKRGEKYYLFRLFPKLIALVVPWLLCYILTVTDTFPNDPSHPYYKARTDVKLESLRHSKWFYFPYPGRWGTPLFDAGIMCSYLAASLVGMFESIGDYYVLAGCCEKSSPPTHAINRALATEGLLNVICGSLNLGIGTVSYSEPVSFIVVSGMASRRTWQLYSVALIVAGVIGKFSGALAMIPEPILGGYNIIGLGMLTSIGISHLQHLDMNAARNLMTFGVSIIMGLAVPFWIADNPEIINTGYVIFDDIVRGLLGTSMFIGSFIGFTLDNLIPGSPAERGLISYQVQLGRTDKMPDKDASIYDLPLISSKLLRNKCCSYIPFLPSYKERKCSSNCCRRQNDKTNAMNTLGEDTLNNPDHSLIELPLSELNTNTCC